jgi:predicted ABC-type transport system involved in lysophospholipase L1 biosynthesis ATPase subunit
MTNAPMIDVREATNEYDDGPPALLLADEPTGALDSSSAEDVRRLLLAVSR